MKRLRRNLENLFDRMMEERPTREELARLRRETMRILTEEEATSRFLSGSEERQRKAQLGW